MGHVRNALDDAITKITFGFGQVCNKINEHQIETKTNQSSNDVNFAKIEALIAANEVSAQKREEAAQKHFEELKMIIAGNRKEVSDTVNKLIDSHNLKNITPE